MVATGANPESAHVRRARLLGLVNTRVIRAARSRSPSARVLFALSGQRNVRAPGVPARERPLGFAVSHEEKAQALHVQFRISGRSSPYV